MRRLRPRYRQKNAGATSRGVRTAQELGLPSLDWGKSSPVSHAFPRTPHAVVGDPSVQKQRHAGPHAWRTPLPENALSGANATRRRGAPLHTAKKAAAFLTEAMGQLVTEDMIFDWSPPPQDPVPKIRPHHQLRPRRVARRRARRRSPGGTPHEPKKMARLGEASATTETASPQSETPPGHCPGGASGGSLNGQVEDHRSEVLSRRTRANKFAAPTAPRGTCPTLTRRHVQGAVSRSTREDPMSISNLVASPNRQQVGAAPAPHPARR